MDHFKNKPDSLLEGEDCPTHTRMNASLPLVDDFNFDHQELAILDIIRHISCSLATPDYEGLQKSLECAHQLWSPNQSKRIVESVNSLLGIMRATRTRAFDFIVADCPECSRRICQSELQIMMLLREGRLNDIDRLASAAQLVIGAGEHGNLMLAAKVLGSLIDEYAHQGHATEKPMLH